MELRHGEQQWEREHGACATVRGGQMYCHGYGVPRDGEKMCCCFVLFCFVCLFVFVVVVVLDSVYFNETLIGLGLVCFWTKLIYVVRGLISDLCEWRRLCFVGRDNTHVGDIYASKGISRLGNILMHSKKKKNLYAVF